MIDWTFFLYDSMLIRENVVGYVTSHVNWIWILILILR